jgi:hypothetical protein
MFSLHPTSISVQGTWKRDVTIPGVLPRREKKFLNPWDALIELGTITSPEREVYSIKPPINY